MKDIILSICVATYNGGERLEKLVKHVLTSKRCDIEIAIADNCSSDDTFERISRIRDDRVHIYENELNLGSLDNGIRSLQYGKGKYLMLFNDRDVIQPEYLDEYVEFLKVHTFGVILNMCTNCNDYFGGVLEKEAIYYYLTISPHPSYYVFRKDCFERVELTEELRANGYYPALIGIAIAKTEDVYMNQHIPIMMGSEAQYISMHGSRSWSVIGDTRDALSKNSSFTPEDQMGRLEEYIEYCMTVCDKMQLYHAQIAIYKGMLENTMDYFYFLDASQVRHRYQIPDYHYNWEDYLNLVDIFYKRYIAYANAKKLDYDVEVIELINEIVTLQFINNAIPQLQSSFLEKKERIVEIKKQLYQKGIQCDIASQKTNVVFRKGIGTNQTQKS